MIRDATTSDATAIRRLMQTVPGFWQDWWSEKTIADAIRAAADLAFVWEADSQIVGFLCAHNLGFRAYLSELIVHPNYRRQGIAEELIRVVEATLSEQNQKILIADVWRDAAPFYESQGWVPPQAVLLRRQWLNHSFSKRRSL